MKKSVERLIRLEQARDEGRFDLLSKKEALELTREIAKMDRNLGGIKKMKGLPAALFIIDPRKEHIAIDEARKLNIPVVALCDTNCDPTGVEYVIPGNDDAIKSIRLFTGALADAILEGRQSSTQRQAKVYVGEDAADKEAAPVEVIKRGAAPEPTPEA